MNASEQIPVKCRLFIGEFSRCTSGPSRICRTLRHFRLLPAIGYCKIWSTYLPRLSRKVTRILGRFFFALWGLGLEGVTT